MKQVYVKPETAVQAVKMDLMLKSGSRPGGGEGGIHSRGLGLDDEEEAGKSSNSLW